MRYHRTFGLDAEQLDELEELIEERLAEPWDKGIGRPKSLSLREAIMVTLLYTRQNLIEEVIADLFGVAQATVSEIITKFTPLIAQATEEFRSDAEEAKQMTRGRMALVDGTLWPCWSWETAPEMWAGKYKTPGTFGLGVPVAALRDGSGVIQAVAGMGGIQGFRRRRGGGETAIPAGGVWRIRGWRTFAGGFSEQSLRFRGLGAAVASAWCWSGGRVGGPQHVAFAVAQAFQRAGGLLVCARRGGLAPDGRARTASGSAVISPDRAALSGPVRGVSPAGPLRSAGPGRPVDWRRPRSLAALAQLGAPGWS